jgi:RNA polymerase sigma-70 factor, ECF subfamily
MRGAADMWDEVETRTKDERMSQCKRRALCKESDSLLVAAAKKGEPEAFEFLVSRHEARVLSVAFRITRNREDARDVAQQSFYKAFAHLGTFHEKSAFSTWLTRIAINEALMWLRRNRSRREISLEEGAVASEGTSSSELHHRVETPEEIYERDARARLLRECVSQMREQFRSVLSLQLEERTVGETARILRVRLGTLKARLFRARQQLRVLLQQNDKTPREPGMRRSRTQCALEGKRHFRGSALSRG